MATKHPDAALDELNAVIHAASMPYNRRPPAELGGLSPMAVFRLIHADWYGADSAIQLNDSIALEELEAVRRERCHPGARVG